MQLKSVINYSNKLILAPMVRASLLPLRLLALRNGADLVYTDEIIDHSMLSTTRKVNDILGTIDYINEENAYVLFRTSPIEKEKLVFQIGTANVNRAIKVAKMVENDVSAIDINMGCPKEYSVSLGIGAALLSNVERAKSIVKGLVENIQLPITCKIRISNDIDKTISMVKDFETLGVSAVAVHGRTRDQGPKDPVDKDAIRKIAESVNIPIIANGGSLDIKNLADLLKFKEDCGASSVMVARAAHENVGVFREEGRIPVTDLVTEYLKLCIEFDNSWKNVIYSLNHMLKHSEKWKYNHKQLQKATSLEEICDLWNLGDYCREKNSEYRLKGMISYSVSPVSGSETPTEMLKSREQMFDGTNIIVEWMEFHRRGFDVATLPKTVLNVYCVKHHIPLPTYESKRMDRRHYSIIKLNDKQYTTVIWHRNKKIGEQAAALVCAFNLGLYEEDYLLSVGCLIKRSRYAHFIKTEFTRNLLMSVGDDDTLGRNYMITWITNPRMGKCNVVHTSTVSEII